MPLYSLYYTLIITVMTNIDKVLESPRTAQRSSAVSSTMSYRAYLTST